MELQQVILFAFVGSYKSIFINRSLRSYLGNDYEKSADGFRGILLTFLTLPMYYNFTGTWTLSLAALMGIGFGVCVTIYDNRTKVKEWFIVRTTKKLK